MLRHFVYQLPGRSFILTCQINSCLKSFRNVVVYFHYIFEYRTFSLVVNNTLLHLKVGVFRRFLELYFLNIIKDIEHQLSNLLDLLDWSINLDIIF